MINSIDALSAGAAGEPERPRIVLEASGSNDVQADPFHHRSDLSESIPIVILFSFDVTSLRVAFQVAGIAVFFFF